MSLLQTVFFVAIVGNAIAQTCNGLANYRLEITMQWTRVTDSDFTKKMAVGGVLSVVHNEHYHLFEVNKNLSTPLKHLMVNNKIGPALDWLEQLKNNRKHRVYDYDYVTGAKNEDVIKLNVKMNGDRGATYVSFMGVLLGTPDYFFGERRINMCQPTPGQFVNGVPVKNFTKRFPEKGKEAWVKAFDAGYDARTKISPGTNVIPQYRGVEADKRRALGPVNRYAQFRMTPGLYDGYFAFWKILVIVGVLATAALVAFICLYPVCCKKQMLDVPVPLQDESQWAT